MSSYPPGLYVVATPLGNLGDLSPRALGVLRAADIIAAEDTRTTRRLLGETPSARLVSLTEYNVTQRAPSLVEAARDGVVALVSEAGTPAIADPGARLVAAAHESDVAVRAVPGPSALAAAISVAGLDAQSVHFLAFLPRPAGERKTRIASAAANAEALVFYESPRRLAATLTEIAGLLGDPVVVVCRELTKLHEEVVRGPASELAARFADARGECTVVVQCPPRPAADADALQAFLADMHEAGARRSSAAAIAARRFGVPRSAAYDAWPPGPPGSA